jgi:putative sigma-54 modulation protein
MVTRPAPPACCRAVPPPPPDARMPLRIDFTDRHEQHPPSVRDYALEKAEKIPRFFDGVNHVQIVLDREHDKHTAEMVVTAAPNLRFVGHSAAKTVTEAIDKALDKLERQVIKAKERLKDHRRKPER